jgi:hypothetical protein
MSINISIKEKTVRWCSTPSYYYLFSIFLLSQNKNKFYEQEKIAKNTVLMNLLHLGLSSIWIDHLHIRISEHSGISIGMGTVTR